MWRRNWPLTHQNNIILPLLSCSPYDGTRVKEVSYSEQKPWKRWWWSELMMLLVPVMGGFLYWALFRCSSTNLGVTQMTCWPFQYLTMLRDCSVLMMSLCVMLVIWLWMEHTLPVIFLWSCFNDLVWCVMNARGVRHHSVSTGVPEIFNGQRPSEVSQDLQQNPRPVAPVAQLPQIGQRLLWRTHGTL